ncbi:MAG: DNA repair protein RecO [Aquificae bacterium]|nr:DNA repair protein RecO [Aquificota bacterium]
METIFKDEAIVLRKSPVGDIDLSITVYTKQTGKENIYLPKGQVIKSNLITVSEPFNWFRGVFRHIKGKLYLQEIDSFRNLALPITKDLERFYTAFDINITFNRYVIFPDDRFFILLKKTLYYLSQDSAPHIIKTNFIVKLIYLSGIFPQLDKCQICNVKINQKNFGTVSIEKTGCLCKDCIMKNHQRYPFSLIRDINTMKNISFQKLKNINIPKSQLNKIEKFCKVYLSHHL